MKNENQQLIDFIKDSRQAGKSDSQIREELLGAGWPASDINSVLEDSRQMSSTKPKKQSKNWYIAVTHYLTAGFAVPFVFFLILGFFGGLLRSWMFKLLFLGKLGSFGSVFLYLNTIITEHDLIQVVSVFIIDFFGIWLGVKYAAKFIAKTYIVMEVNKIINLATIYFAVIGIGWRLVGIEILDSKFIIDFGLFIVLTLSFFLFSKKHLYNT